MASYDMNLSPNTGIMPLAAYAAQDLTLLSCCKITGIIGQIGQKLSAGAPFFRLTQCY